jgi:hypothetical protein
MATLGHISADWSSQKLERGYSPMRRKMAWMAVLFASAFFQTAIRPEKPIECHWIRIEHSGDDSHPGEDQVSELGKVLF